MVVDRQANVIRQSDHLCCRDPTSSAHPWTISFFGQEGILYGEFAMPPPFFEVRINSMYSGIVDSFDEAMSSPISRHSRHWTNHMHAVDGYNAYAR